MPREDLKNFKVVKKEISRDKSTTDDHRTRNNSWNTKDIDKEVQKSDIKNRYKNTCPCIVDKFFIEEETSNLVTP